MGNHRCDGHRRLARPDRVQRVVGLRDQGAAGLFRPDPIGLDLAFGMEPGIVAELASRRQMGGDPGGRRMVLQVVRREELRDHLSPNLKRVAAIDENGRPLGQHHQQARRAAETAQPAHAVGPHRRIFALIDITARHQETVQAAAAQFGPQQGQPLGRRWSEWEARIAFRLDARLQGHQLPA